MSAMSAMRVAVGCCLSRAAIALRLCDTQNDARLRSRFRRALMRVIVLVVGLLVSPMGLAPGLAQSDFWFVPERGPYRELVERYRAADLEAITDLLGRLEIEPDTVDRHVEDIRAQDVRAFNDDALPNVNQQLFRAAAMLHTDAAQQLWSKRRRQAAVRHIELAREWAEAGTGDLPPLWSVPSGSRDRRFRGPGSRGGTGSFRRRWYLAAGLLVLTREGFIPAIEFLEDASRTVPDDVALLTTTGWLKERLALAAVYVRGMPLVAIQRAKERELTAAAEWLRQALEVDPEAPEAAVRLARIQMLLGDDDAAETGLTRLVDRTDLSPDHAYLSRLLLGRLYEDREEPDRAVSLYEEASAILPRSQSVWMALARLSLESGDWRTAVAAVERPLRDSATPELIDPWTDYVLGKGEGPALLAALRAEVRSW